MMKQNNNPAKTLAEVIETRISTRSFAAEIPHKEDINEIVRSAVLAPYGGATGIPLSEIRKIFILSQGTKTMEKAREMLLTQVKRNSKKIAVLLLLLPFLRKKMRPFSNRLKAISKNGIPSLKEAAYFVIIAEKKGFPPVEKQSIAHALQNMWLSATAVGLGFQLISCEAWHASQERKTEPK
jgi:nitroreductase